MPIAPPRPLHRSPVLASSLLALMLLAGACTQSALEFTIGECVNLPDGTQISDYETVDCAEAHDAEVYALPQHPDGPDAAFPGQADLETFADERCKEDFEDYVGIAYDDSIIYSTALTPSQESWDAAEDREIVCLLVGEPVTSEDGSNNFAQLTGSKQGANE